MKLDPELKAFFEQHLSYLQHIQQYEELQTILMIFLSENSNEIDVGSAFKKIQMLYAKLNLYCKTTESSTALAKEKDQQNQEKEKAKR